MDRITRKELKTDHFVEEFGQTVKFLAERRKQVVIITLGAIVAIAVIGAVYFYQRQQRIERQTELFRLREVETFPVNPQGQGPEGARVFRSAEAKRSYLTKGYSTLASRYPGTSEACMALIALGGHSVEAGNIVEAQHHFESASRCGKKDLESLARLSLAAIYAGQGKRDEAEKLLRELIAKPTPMVSSEQATIALARILAPVRPAEAKKLLEPLRASSNAIAARAALLTLTELEQTN